ncbi:MAG: hypothetical protein VX527_00925 [Planctomycetota bacterium]|nr:hypothetical protein [Planctomycetota bacterium]
MKPPSTAPTPMGNIPDDPGLGTVTSSEILLLVMGGILTIAVAIVLIMTIARKQVRNQ